MTTPSPVDPPPGPAPLTGPSAADNDLLQAHLEVKAIPAGGVVLARGGAERALLWLRAGSARAHLEIDGQRFVVDRFQPGAVLGELGFFDPSHQRAVEVIAETDVLVDVLPLPAYEALRDAGAPVVAQIEAEVLLTLGARMAATSERLGALLTARHDASAWQRLRRFFGLEG